MYNFPYDMHVGFFCETLHAPCFTFLLTSKSKTRLRNRDYRNLHAVAKLYIQGVLKNVTGVGLFTCVAPQAMCMLNICDAS